MFEYSHKVLRGYRKAGQLTLKPGTQRVTLLIVKMKKVRVT
jgi:hypothetical protein